MVCDTTNLCKTTFKEPVDDELFEVGLSNDYEYESSKLNVVERIDEFSGLNRKRCSLCKMIMKIAKKTLRNNRSKVLLQNL